MEYGSGKGFSTRVPDIFNAQYPEGNSRGQLQTDLL